MATSTVPVLVLLGASILWGLTWIPLKYFGGFGISGPWVTLFAHGSVGVLCLPLVWRYRHRLWPLRGWVLALAFFGALANVCFASAMVMGEVPRMMVLFYLLPAWSVLGGRLFLGEQIDGVRALSVGLALLGALFILGGPVILSAPPSFADLVAVLAGFGLAANNVLFRKLQGLPVSAKLAVAFVGCLLGSLLLTQLASLSLPASVPSEVWLELVLFGLFWILLATIGTQFGVHHLEAGRSSVLIITELITAVGTATLASRKPPTLGEALGGVLVVVAALLEARRHPRVAFDD